MELDAQESSLAGDRRPQSGQEDWLAPADHLAVRYQLGSVLQGRMPPLGVASASSTASAAPPTRVVGTPLQRASVNVLVERLDAAPGVASIERRVAGLEAEARAGETIRQILSTRQYQLA
jgi:hypothetical protein